VSGVGKSGDFRHAAEAGLGQGDVSSGVLMPLLRFIAVALVAASTAAPFSAVAEPLDKESCLKLQGERRTLLTREMQAALDHGPDWVKDHLDTQKIEKVREFLDIERNRRSCRAGHSAAAGPQAHPAAERGCRGWPRHAIARPQPQFRGSGDRQCQR
jgi:hypothetical protein